MSYANKCLPGRCFKILNGARRRAWAHTSEHGSTPASPGTCQWPRNTSTSTRAYQRAQSHINVRRNTSGSPEAHQTKPKIAQKTKIASTSTKSRQSTSGDGCAQTTTHRVDTPVWAKRAGPTHRDTTWKLNMQLCPMTNASSKT